MKITPNSRALVTGAASGLGLALATQLAARGVRVLATDVHEEPSPELAAVAGVD